MTQDEIIEMAKQAGFTQPEGETWYEAFPQCIETLIKLVAAKEREACAKVCEEHLDGLSMIGGAFVTCASAIRARGEA